MMKSHLTHHTDPRPSTSHPPQPQHSPSSPLIIIIIIVVVTKVVRHEAAHFLIAYLLGCPIEACYLNAREALKDARLSGQVC
jgi:hypothetical protein